MPVLHDSGVGFYGADLVMKLIRRQKIWLAIIVVANLALWLIPSDVVEQIARDRQTMLGRYSRQHFTWIVGIGFFSAISLYVDWATGVAYKRRWFQVIAVLLLLAPTVAVVDWLTRSPQRSHYIQDTLAYHHPPESEFQREYTDRPEAHRTYPDAPAGYGTVRCTLNTDRRGFRNQQELDQYAVVAIGDSFTEGSNVSDEHTWPARLNRDGGLSVYNMGVSGYDPIHYLAALREYALALKPRFVVCMLYEGNDFRSAKSDLKRTGMSASRRLSRYIKQSPVIDSIDRFLIDTFSPINCQGSVAGIELLDWMPLRIPDSRDAKYYAFAPKQLRDLYITREEFSRDKHWLNPRSLLAEMDALCRESGVTLVIAYAPTKAHVVLPLAADRLPAHKVRDFTAYSYKYELPEPDQFLPALVDRVESREVVVGQWCAKQNIEFISVTESLRTAAQNGTQVYYAYDQHWTPEGHAVVSERVGQVLNQLAGNVADAATH